LRTIQKALFPGAPEEISHLPDDKAELARSTLLKPLRVTTGGPETGVYAAELKDNILNDQLTVELILAVFWMPELILRPGTGEEGLFEFSINIPGKTQAEKITAINSQLRISGEKAMREIMGKHSAGWAIAYLDLLNGYVRARIAESVVQWGIIITDVSVEGVGGSHDVNIALGAIPAAKARSQAAGIEAAGEKDRLITVSEGEAQAKVNIGKAKGEAYRLKAEGMGMTPREILDRKLAPKVFGNKTVIVGGEDGVSKMMGLAMATLRAKVGDKE
jgi:regulator of protease activity HflC (stomatin/prohibitin superfamily)